MNRELLQQLYARYSREIYLYLFSLCGSAPPAEDLLQETFLQALLSLSDCHSNARAWLYLVARNLYLNYRKKAARNISLEQMAEIPSHSREEPPERLIRGESLRLLRAAIENLESRLREVVILQYFSGLSQKEIAALLQLTPEHVRVLSFRARKKLKSYLEVNGYDVP